MAAWDNDPVVGEGGNAWDNDPVVEAAPPPAPPQPVNTLGQEALRQGGLALRNVSTALASPLSLGGNAIGAALNVPIRMAGGPEQYFRPSTDVVQQGLTKAGLPQATRPIEKFTQGMAESAPAFAMPAGLMPQAFGNAAIGAAQEAHGDFGSSGLVGLAGGAAGHVLSRTLAGLRPSDASKFLESKGIVLTPGQRAGQDTWLGRAEAGLAKAPIVGAPVRTRQAEAMEQWQQATRSAAEPDARTIDAVKSSLSQAYDNVLDGQMIVTPASRDLTASASSSPAKMYHQQEINLKAEAGQYLKSQDPTHIQEGNRLWAQAQELAKWWRSKLPPAQQQQIAQIDAAYAQYVPIRKASSTGQQTLEVPENYTPNMLLQAIRMNDKSVGKARFTGFQDLPQQQLARTGQQAIGSRVNAPNVTSNLLTPAASIAGGVANAPVAISAGLGALAYGTKPGQRAARGVQNVVSREEAEALLKALRIGAQGTVTRDDNSD